MKSCDIGIFAFFWTFLTFSCRKMVIRVLFESENFFYNFAKFHKKFCNFGPNLAIFGIFSPNIPGKKGVPISFSDRAQKVFAFEN